MKLKGMTALAVLALIASVAVPNLSLNPRVASAAAVPSHGRFFAEKDCGGNNPYHVGGYCTITMSTLPTLLVRSNIFYLQPLAPNALDTDIAIEVTTGNTILGHCTWPFSNPTGVCVLSGGTGVFSNFHAKVTVTSLGGLLYSWDGTYSFGEAD
jgi:hypothetical protein